MTRPSHRFFALAAVSILIVAAGCSSDDGTKTASSTTAPTTTSAADRSTTTTATGAPSIDDIAAVVCDGAPVRMGADAEGYTAASYECTGSGENVRIDLYESAAQQAEANQVVLDFYRDAGDDRSLAELPLLCGPQFAVGYDTNEARDAAIGALSAAGLDAALCE